jgi:hypothetical protein
MLQAQDALDEWVEGVVFQIAKAKRERHRWFDSGDLQSALMLWAICQVAKATPDVIHYLPTKEVGYVKKFLERFGSSEIPTNLMVRISTAVVDGPLQAGLNGYTEQLKTSTVHKENPTGFVCPASQQSNQCLTCDACWRSDVENISYPLH